MLIFQSEILRQWHWFSVTLDFQPGEFRARSFQRSADENLADLLCLRRS